jgi:hypothetical protein
MVSNPKKATSYVVIIIKNKNLKIKTYYSNSWSVVRIVSVIWLGPPMCLIVMIIIFSTFFLVRDTSGPHFFGQGNCDDYFRWM